MPNKVVPTFFKKTVSFKPSVVLEDTLTESIFLSVTPVTTIKPFNVSMPTGVVLEDSLSEAITLSFRPTVKIMETAQTATQSTTTVSNYQYWTG